MTTRRISWALPIIVVVACGGQATDGKDSGADSATCMPDLSPCNYDTDCCGLLCAGNGLCGCIQSNQSGCIVDSDCCNTTCFNGVCH